MRLGCSRLCNHGRCRGWCRHCLDRGLDCVLRVAALGLNGRGLLHHRLCLNRLVSSSSSFLVRDAGSRESFLLVLHSGLQICNSLVVVILCLGCSMVVVVMVLVCGMVVLVRDRCRRRGMATSAQPTVAASARTHGARTCCVAVTRECDDRPKCQRSGHHCRSHCPLRCLHN